MRKYRVKMAGKDNKFRYEWEEGGSNCFEVFIALCILTYGRIVRFRCDMSEEVIEAELEEYRDDAIYCVTIEPIRSKGDAEC